MISKRPAFLGVAAATDQEWTAKKRETERRGGGEHQQPLFFVAYLLRLRGTCSNYIRRGLLGIRLSTDMVFLQKCVICFMCFIMLTLALKKSSNTFVKKRVASNKKCKTPLCADSTEISVEASILEIEASEKKILEASLNSMKALMLFFYATQGCVMPFIPIYYKSLGITETNIGILGAVTPTITFLASPLWGILADATNMHNVIMLITFIGSAITRWCFVLPGKNMFWLIVLVALSAFLNAPVKPLIDTAVMNLLKVKSDYGKIRVFGQIGFGLGSALVGPLLGSSLKYVFYAHAILAVPTAALMLILRSNNQISTTSESNKAGEGKGNILLALIQFYSNKMIAKKGAVSGASIDILAGVKLVVSDPEVLIFFLLVFLIGVSSGVVENFAYVRLADVGGTGECFGVCRMASSLAGGPMFWLSGKLMQKIGVNGVLMLSLISYTLRFLIYSTITNPWHAMPAEILRYKLLTCRIFLCIS